ncbi:TPA: glycosyltransferase family 4 protein [Photobacterium damselae]
MKNICFFITSIGNCGGTERVSILIANELVKKGYNVTFLSLFLNKYDDIFFPIEKEIKIEKLYNEKKNFNVRYFSILNKLNVFINNNCFDIFIDVDTILSVYSAPVIRNKNIKYISWEHFHCGMLMGSRKRNIARFIASKCAHSIICLTDYDLKQWKNKFKINNVHCINNPLTYDRDNMISDGNSKIILTACRLEYIKGIDLLIESWFKSNLKNKGWLLYVVGNGSQANILKEKVKILGLLESVKFFDRSDNLSDFYNKAAVFALSSRDESFGMVITEAFSFGIPVISFKNNGGPSEIIDDNHNGWLVDCYDTNSYAEKLNHLDYLVTNDILKLYKDNAINSCYKYKMDYIYRQWESLFNYISRV